MILADDMLLGYEPHDWLGITGLGILALGGMVTAWITAHGARRSANTIKDDVAAVRDQVQNSHPTNLRDDIDEITAAVRGMREHQWELTRDVSGIRTDIGQLREELRDERTDRIAGDERIINEHIKLEIQRHPE